MLPDVIIHSSPHYLSTGRLLGRLKTKENFSYKSSRGRLREVVAYNFTRGSKYI